MEQLLRAGADARRVDRKGNNCLHYATAWGNLKAVRLLMQAGADPLGANAAGWTPEYYSLSVQAEVYYRNLVAEYARRRIDDKTKHRERQAKGGGAVRLVATEDTGSETGSEESRSRADSGESPGTIERDGGLGIRIAK